MCDVRKVLWYQIEEAQTIQWPKEKGQKEKQLSTKHYTSSTSVGISLWMYSSHNAKLILIHSCAQIRFNSTQHDFHIRWCSRRLRVTQRYNGQKKKDKRKNNYLQNITQKTRDWTTGSPLKPGGELRRSSRVSSFPLLLASLYECTVVIMQS
jgi:hypothetical protein